MTDTGTAAGAFRGGCLKILGSSILLCLLALDGLAQTKGTQAVNLLVPVCFSASHVAYSTLRMEPQYMIIGQAAGVAARMAMESRKAVQEIDTAVLTERLRALGAVL